MSMPGGVKPSQPINEEAAAIAHKVKGELENKTGKKFDVFNPKEFSTQVVAGINYFIKVDVGNGEHVHIRVYKDLQQNVTLHSFQEGKAAQDPLQYF